jgi:hypothetical protein
MLNPTDEWGFLCPKYFIKNNLPKTLTEEIIKLTFIKK